MTNSTNQDLANELAKVIDALIDVKAERDKLRDQRDRLAAAISETAVRTGGLLEGTPLTGPQLCLLMEDMATHMESMRDQLAEQRDELQRLKQPSHTPGVAPVPDFDALQGKRIGELTPEQYADAGEQWLRQQQGYFKDQQYIAFLFHRLDQARGLNPQGKPWLLADHHQRSLPTHEEASSARRPAGDKPPLDFIRSDTVDLNEYEQASPGLG